MSGEEITPFHVIEDSEILWKHPRLKGKIGLRIGIDWHGISEPDPSDEWKLIKTGRDTKGTHLGLVKKVVEGKIVERWLPLDNISSIED